MNKSEKIWTEQIRSRALKEGGFSSVQGGKFKPDATAFAVLALKSAGLENDPIISASRSALVARQMPDGRVPQADFSPEAFWPTSLALLAWKGDSNSESAAAQAIDFLLNIESVTYPAAQNNARTAGHDYSIVGWPWVTGTFGWLVPTAYATMALKAYGRSREKRIVEARRFIIDRQLPSGGWNYGGTLVFDKELEPFPDTTGIALVALTDLCSNADVKKSISYLEGCIDSIRSPHSLSWGILGLSAWDRRPVEADHWIMESLSMQNFYGNYDTECLSLLCLAWYSAKNRFGMML